MLSFCPPLYIGEPLKIKDMIEEVRLLLDNPKNAERLGYEQAIQDVIELLTNKEKK